jgi:hypothetical protein
VITQQAANDLGREFDIDRLGIEARQFVFDPRNASSIWPVRNISVRRCASMIVSMPSNRSDMGDNTRRGHGVPTEAQPRRSRTTGRGAALPGLLFDPHRQFPALGAAMDDRCPCGHAGGRPQRSCARSTPCSFVDPAQADRKVVSTAFLGQTAVQLFDKMFDSDMPSQLAAILVVVLIDSQPRAEPGEHLDDLGRSLLG